MRRLPSLFFGDPRGIRCAPCLDSPPPPLFPLLCRPLFQPFFFVLPSDRPLLAYLVGRTKSTKRERIEDARRLRKREGARIAWAYRRLPGPAGVASVCRLATGHQRRHRRHQGLTRPQRTGAVAVGWRPSSSSCAACGPPRGCAGQEKKKKKSTPAIREDEKKTKEKEKEKNRNGRTCWGGGESKKKRDPCVSISVPGPCAD